MQKMMISKPIKVTDPQHKRYGQEGYIVKLHSRVPYVDVFYTQDQKVYSVEFSSLKVLEEDF